MTDADQPLEDAIYGGAVAGESGSLDSALRTAITQLTLRHPELVRSLVLMDTAAGKEPNWFRYHVFRLVARWFGPRAVAGRIMPILFGKKPDHELRCFQKLARMS